MKNISIPAIYQRNHCYVSRFLNFTYFVQGPKRTQRAYKRPCLYLNNKAGTKPTHSLNSIDYILSTKPLWLSRCRIESTAAMKYTQSDLPLHRVNYRKPYSINKENSKPSISFRLNHSLNNKKVGTVFDNCGIPLRQFRRTIHSACCTNSQSNPSISSATPAAGLEVDTIFSLSSGHGKCGVAVVRVSGPGVGTVLARVGRFRGAPEPRKAYLRTLVHPVETHAIDKGLILYFPGPSSFTGEDCAELQVHGGPAVVAALLSALHTVPGCRQADPGEFTKRAFLNSKLDLTEVEGLGDLIHAETEAQRRQALRQMDGDLSRLYSSWRRDIIKCVADLEAYIDFGEEQHIDENVTHQVTTTVARLQREISGHLNDKRQGERLREGVQVVIVGEPNVGKSSLLNAICQRPAAIVTEIAGTTRDVIDTPVNIGGYPVLLSDTAGLRETHDVVESEGVMRALKRAQQADIRVLVLDITKTDLDLLQQLQSPSFVEQELKSLGIKTESISEESDNVNNISNLSASQCVNIDTNTDISTSLNTIIVLNKSDLLNANERKHISELLRGAVTPECNINNHNVIESRTSQQGENRGTMKANQHSTSASKTDIEPHSSREQESTPAGMRTSVPLCSLSCIHGNGMEEFLAVLKDRVAEMCGNPLAGHPSLTQARHRSHLIRCLRHLDDYDHMTRRDEVVLASQALRGALWEIGKITGKVTSEDILDVIFKDFCIGK